MATPPVLTGAQSITITRGTPGSIELPVKNPDGTDLDITTGYTVGILIRPSANENPSAASVAPTGFTLTPGNGKVTASWGFAMDENFFNAQNSYALVITNDSWATKSVPQAGRISVVQTALG